MLRIRPYAPGDAVALGSIFFQAVREVGLTQYSQAQVEAWAPGPITPERYETRAADGRLLLVAVDGTDTPLAYGDLEADGHIDHLFCRPDQAGQGVGSALYDALEAQACAWRLPRLYVEASEVAKRLFLRKGFTVAERREFELRGVLIHHYRMEKRLS